MINTTARFILNTPILHQLLKFGTVGVLAAMVHMLAVVLLVESEMLPPLYANIGGFLLATNVSYLGHRHWTFHASQSSRYLTSHLQFLFVAAFSFCLNEGLYYLLLSYTHLPYALALFIVLAIVPPITFLLSKFWVFRQS